MKDTYTNKWLHYGMLVLIYGTGIFTFLTLTLYHQFFHSGHGENIVYAYQICPHIGNTYTISIHNDRFVPNKLMIARCAVVRFQNDDLHALYLPSLGDHPHDILYAGFTPKVLGYHQEEMFIAHTPGVFSFHDHLKDQIEGTLFVHP